MKLYEILIIIAAAAFVAGVILWRIIRRRHGKGGCDCGCKHCAGCAACASRPQKKDAKDAK